ncbi:MAG: DUF3869 domain-containing protein [Bacteroidaceae bacterium]|nr:DUF3869 domain-containing protein [Bacteroidaceae bacterium]
MKKINFLKGLSAKFAFAVVALGAAFTSCTKEEFNVEVEPNNAKIYFNPSVVNPIANATVSATFTGAETITGTPNIAAGSTTITATAADGATGSTTVAYDAVQAGATATYSPIIYLSNGLFKLVKVSAKATTTTKAGNVTNGHSHNGSAWYVNKSDYSAAFTAEWDKTGKTTMTVNNIAEDGTLLQSYLSTLGNTEITVSGSETHEVAAWEMVSSIFTITSLAETFDVVAVANENFVVANVTITNPLYAVDVDLNRAAIPGHEGHYHAGHSHGASDNAGGGIGWAE